MAAFDMTQFSEFREIFPELTPVQFETAMLFALGISQKDIAALRSVSYSAVKKTLFQTKNKFEPHSLYRLSTVFHVRFVLFVLQG
ncbi:transcriptional regulator [Candidatus Regiella endosymbiont of Tuberolachnus salignus]|uniref:helix-turn-helix transcriptional regulator n=1 Tax=Candidatus Regiella endosymbiont of Tuberolachnus salignus TaxID=3077956 RepID=UPI0030CF7688